jgi:hypothetical protein
MKLDPQIAQSLLQQLIEFGLDPIDWSLQILEKNRIRISHRSEQGFEFLGFLAPKNQKWAKLELLSL